MFVENESFRPDGGVEVDQVAVGAFATAEPNPGEALEASGELRSYLVQLTPTEKEGAEEEVETSLTFDHPVVGVIFSSDRLDSSDAAVGSALEEAGRRGLDSGEDEILLSEDRRTLNLRFRGGGDHAEQVRVLVALNLAAGGTVNCGFEGLDCCRWCTATRSACTGRYRDGRTGCRCGRCTG